MNAIEATTLQHGDVVTTAVLQPEVGAGRTEPDRLARVEDGRTTEAHALAALLRRIGRAAAAGGRSRRAATAAPRRELPVPFC